jgi:hypothetical protein
MAKTPAKSPVVPIIKKTLKPRIKPGGASNPIKLPTRKGGPVTR